MKTLGVLGGMGPAACAEFLKILARDAPAKNDSEHPKIIMLSDPETPDRSDGLMGLGPDPLPVIRRVGRRIISRSMQHSALLH